MISQHTKKKYAAIMVDKCVRNTRLHSLFLYSLNPIGRHSDMTRVGSGTGRTALRALRDAGSVNPRLPNNFCKTWDLNPGPDAQQLCCATTRPIRQNFTRSRLHKHTTSTWTFEQQEAVINSLYNLEGNLPQHKQQFYQSNNYILYHTTRLLKQVNTK